MININTLGYLFLPTWANLPFRSLISCNGRGLPCFARNHWHVLRRMTQMGTRTACSHFLYSEVHWHSLEKYSRKHTPKFNPINMKCFKLVLHSLLGIISRLNGILNPLTLCKLSLYKDYFCLLKYKSQCHSRRLAWIIDSTVKISGMSSKEALKPSWNIMIF